MLMRWVLLFIQATLLSAATYGFLIFMMAM
jgi:hypothetical protein